MSPVAAEDFAGDIDADQTIEAIADRVEAADEPFRVLSGGQPVGQIEKQSVIDVLVGRK